MITGPLPPPGSPVGGNEITGPLQPPGSPVGGGMITGPLPPPGSPVGGNVISGPLPVPGSPVGGEMIKGPPPPPLIVGACSVAGAKLVGLGSSSGGVVPSVQMPPADAAAEVYAWAPQRPIAVACAEANAVLLQPEADAVDCADATAPEQSTGQVPPMAVADADAKADPQDVLAVATADAYAIESHPALAVALADAIAVSQSGCGQMPEDKEAYCSVPHRATAALTASVYWVEPHP